MIDDKIQMLSATVKKLYRRGADQNIRRILNKTHHADVAGLLDNFSAEDRIHIFNLISTIEIKAQVLSYLKDESQIEIIHRLTRQEVLNIVSLLESDDAADLLGNLSEEEAKEILDSMKKQDSDEVADLMGYPEDSAGGLMNSDYLSFIDTTSVSEVIEFIQNVEDSMVSFYVYVENEHKHLIGVVSLKQLLLCKKSDLLKNIMASDVVSVTLDAHKNQVAKMVEKYDFLCLPVVDSNNALMGVVTVDDVLDVIREEVEENLMQMGRAGIGGEETVIEHLIARLPWVLLTLFGGLISFGVIYFIGGVKTGGPPGPLWVVVGMVPLLLSVVATVGNQAMVVAIGAIKSGSYKAKEVFSGLRREFLIALSFSVLLALVLCTLGFFIGKFGNAFYLFSGVLAMLVVVSQVLGVFMPKLVQRLGQDPTIVAVPIFILTVELFSIAIFFSFMTRTF